MANNIITVNKFLDKFSSLFSNKQFLAFQFFIYAFFYDYKRNCIYSMSKQSHFDYQSLQYFFSESNWDIDKLNTKRVHILQSQLTTSSTSSGILAIDDTGCPKPYAKNTEGAKFQYCGPLKRNEICNVSVASAFLSDSRSFIVNNKFYKPHSEFMFGKNDVDFKSKIQLAKELVYDALDKHIKFSCVATDSWYASVDFIESLHSKNIIYVSEIRDNRNILFYHPVLRKHCWLQQDELVKLIKKHYWHKVKFFHRTLDDGRKVSAPVYSFKSQFVDCQVPIKVVVFFDKWRKEDVEDKDFHIIFSTDTSLHFDTIINFYLMRWGIEHLFKHLKDIFYFDQYQVRHQKQIQRYWALCILALSMVYWIKQNGCLTKIIPKKLQTFNQYRDAIKSMIEFDSFICMSKNRTLLDAHCPIKSNRLLTHLKKAA